MSEKIIEIIAEYLDKDASEFTEDMTFADMGLDSLDVMEVVMKIEDEVDCKIELSQDITNVKTLVEYIESNK